MKIFISILFAIAMVTVTFAQRAEPGQRQTPPSPQEMLERATEELVLTTDQVKQWQDIHEKYRDDLRETDNRRETMRKMGKELEAILSEEQRTAFTEMRARQHPPRRGN
ncbi:MAG: hypothetical protein AAGA85_12190 [Bacteroidota bacterium]